jgi:hypothetical protein
MSEKRKCPSPRPGHVDVYSYSVVWGIGEVTRSLVRCEANIQNVLVPRMFQKPMVELSDRHWIGTGDLLRTITAAFVSIGYTIAWHSVHISHRWFVNAILPRYLISPA